LSTVTPNFNWPVPTSTDLVKDGATAIEALGDSIDASLVDLKGGTSGQVLSKNSNTDMDFVWVTSDDANAIQNTIVDAKGDLITATAADTPARLAVGSNGETLVADSSTSVGIRYQTGVNLNGIINGAMDIWQRGTSFVSTGNIVYTADRWASFRAALGQTVSRQTASLEGFQYSLRSQRDSGNTAVNPNYIFYSMETNDSVRYANKAVTLSFWAKAGANYSSASSALTLQWTTGTGTDQIILNGYTGANNIASTTATLTTSWQRFSYTGTAASNTNEMGVLFASVPVGTAGANDWFEITGVQVEFGSVATNFKRAGGGTIQGELAACQRYYWRSTANANNNQVYGGGYAPGTTVIVAPFSLPVQMRTAPTVIGYANIYVTDETTNFTPSAVVANSRTSVNILQIQPTVTGATAFRPYLVVANGTAGSFIDASAEL
jgi:hypothetical protein